MKSAPITQHDRAGIVQAVAATGTWTGRRYGHRIEIEKDPLPILGVTRVIVRVCIERKWRRAEAQHVTEAVEWLNATIPPPEAEEGEKTRSELRQKAMKEKNTAKGAAR